MESTQRKAYIDWISAFFGIKVSDLIVADLSKRQLIRLLNKNTRHVSRYCGKVLFIHRSVGFVVK